MGIWNQLKTVPIGNSRRRDQIRIGLIRAPHDHEAAERLLTEQIKNRSNVPIPDYPITTRPELHYELIGAWHDQRLVGAIFIGPADNYAYDRDLLTNPTAEHKLLTILINDPPIESRPSTKTHQTRNSAKSPQQVNRLNNSEDTSDTVHWYLRNMFARFLDGKIPPGALIHTPTGTHPLTELIIPSWQISCTPPQTVGFFVGIIRSAYAGTSASGTAYGYLNLAACSASIHLNASQTSIFTSPLSTYTDLAVIAYGQLDKLHNGKNQIRVKTKADITFAKSPVNMKRLGQAYRAFIRHDYHLPREQ